MKSTNNASEVTFSAGAKVFGGATTIAEASLPTLGLLGEDVTLAINQELRTKTDQFPRVPVAQAIMSESLVFQIRLKEPTMANWKLAFNLADADVTNTPGGDVSVTDEAVVIGTDGIGFLTYPVKASTTPTVSDGTGGGATAYAADDDYTIFTRNGQSFIGINPGGALSAGDTVYVDYTYTSLDENEFVLGNQSLPIERKFKLIEYYSNGKRLEMYIPKAIMSVPANLDFNAAENGGEIPMQVSGNYDTGIGGLARVNRFG